MNTVDYRGVQPSGAAGCAPNYGFTINPLDQKCSACGGALTYMAALPVGCDGSNIVIGQGHWSCSWCSDPRTLALQEKLSAMGYHGPPYPAPRQDITTIPSAGLPRCTCGTCPVHGR